MTMRPEQSPPDSSPTGLENRFVDNEPRGIEIDNSDAEGEPFDFGQDDE